MDVDFIFDFASPNAYLAHMVLPQLSARTGARIIYIPCLLGGLFKATGNQAPFVAYANVPNKLAYEMLEFRRFIANHRLTKFQMNPHFPLNTLLIMRGALVARQDGAMDQYIDAVLRAMWEDGKKMDDPSVIAPVLTQAGFDGPALLARTNDPEIKAALVANTEAAVQRGAFGIPTFYAGGEMFFGKERLGQLEAYLLSVKG